MKKLLFIDHFDSFSYNIISWFKANNCEVEVLNYRKIPQNLSELSTYLSKFNAVILSPGPGHPSDYKQSIFLCLNLPKNLPALGICLGHQLLLHSEGASIIQSAILPIHGRQISIAPTSVSSHLSNFSYQGIFVLYNSLGCLSSDKIFIDNWRCLSIDPSTNFALIAEHKHLFRLGVQFHPESFASTGGEIFLKNFLANLADIKDSLV